VTPVFIQTGRLAGMAAAGARSRTQYAVRKAGMSVIPEVFIVLVLDFIHVNAYRNYDIFTLSSRAPRWSGRRAARGFW
jgi:hypothetical protein